MCRNSYSRVKVLVGINQRNAGIPSQPNSPQWSPPSSLPCSPKLWWLFSELPGLFSHRSADLSLDLQLQAQALRGILLSDTESMQSSKWIFFFSPHRYIGFLPGSIPTPAGAWSPGLSPQRPHVEVLRGENSRDARRKTGRRKTRPRPVQRGSLTCHVAQMRIGDSTTELDDSGQHAVGLQQRQRRTGRFSHFYRAREGRRAEISREDADRTSPESCRQGHTW